MRGVYLSTADAKMATGLNGPLFDRMRSNFKIVKKDKFWKYFIPETCLIPKFADIYKDSIIDDGEYVDDAAMVEDILGDVSQDEMISDAQMQALRADNLKARTTYIESKLRENKESTFNEVAAKFYDIFAASFSRFKNDLVKLRLDEYQLNSLQESLEYAFISLKDNLELLKKNVTLSDEDADINEE